MWCPTVSGAFWIELGQSANDHKQVIAWQLIPSRMPSISLKTDKRNCRLARCAINECGKKNNLCMRLNHFINGKCRWGFIFEAFFTMFILNETKWRFVIFGKSILMYYATCVYKSFECIEIPFLYRPTYRFIIKSRAIRKVDDRHRNVNDCDIIRKAFAVFKLQSCKKWYKKEITFHVMKVPSHQINETFLLSDHFSKTSIIIKRANLFLNFEHHYSSLNAIKQ